VFGYDAILDEHVGSSTPTVGQVFLPVAQQ
jgi:hypothetical protein